MAVRISPVGRQQFFDNQGRVANGMKLFTYAAGTTNKLATFTSSTGGVANANPIVLNSDGRTPSGLWLTDGLLYKFVLAPANDTDPPASPVWTEDNIGTGDVTLASLASTSISLGAYLIGWIRQATGAVATTLGKWLGYQPPSVFDFMTAAQIADVLARTSLIDVTVPLQAAVTHALQTGKKLHWPAGTYKITSPILIYTASTFISIRMSGESDSGRGDRGVVIDHTSVLTAPAFIAQGGRVIRIEGFQFSGPNICTPATWLTASEWTVGGVRDQRYSPQCAIAIDPFVNGVPADGGYPNLSAYYTSAALRSSRSAIRDCRFNNQVVGIFNGDNSAANNENNVYENLSFETCKTGISFGQLQSKGCVLRSIFADLCYTVVDTYTYSDRNGSAGFLWVGGDISRCHSVLRTLGQLGAAVSITQGFRIEGLYAEAIWTIGWVGDAIGFAYIPGVFSGCTFWFNGSDTQRVDANFVNFADTKFEDCAFFNPTLADGQKAHAIKFYHESESTAGQKSYLTFDNCRFMSNSLPLFPNAALTDVVMRNCTNHSATGTNNFKATWSDRVKVSLLNEITNQTNIWPGALIENKDTGALIYVKQGMNAVSLGSIAVTVSGFGATFTAADATTLQVGDIVYATNQLLTKIDDTTFTAATWPLGIVTVAATAAITLNDVGPNAASGSMALSLNWYPRMHGPSTIVTHTSTTAEITQTGNATAWQAGDRVIASDLTAGTYLVSGTAPNFVLSKAASGSAASHRCYDADASTITQVAL